jgi:hypothetical protein
VDISLGVYCLSVYYIPDVNRPFGVVGDEICGVAKGFLDSTVLLVVAYKLGDVIL